MTLWHSNLNSIFLLKSSPASLSWLWWWVSWYSIWSSLNFTFFIYWSLSRGNIIGRVDFIIEFSKRLRSYCRQAMCILCPILWMNRRIKVISNDFWSILSILICFVKERDLIHLLFRPQKKSSWKLLKLYSSTSYCFLSLDMKISSFIYNRRSCTNVQTLSGSLRQVRITERIAYSSGDLTGLSFWAASMDFRLLNSLRHFSW